MAKTKDKVSDAAGTVRPYVDRALHDDELRDNVRNAYESARSIYNELMGNRGVTGVATRVATDKDIQSELRSTITELRRAADRVQGKEVAQDAVTAACSSSASCSASCSTRSPGRRRGSGSRIACSAAATTSRTRAATAARRSGPPDLAGRADDRLGGGLLRLRHQQPSVTFRRLRGQRAIDASRGRDRSPSRCPTTAAGSRLPSERSPGARRESTPRRRRSARPSDAPSP